ncbi:MAG: hypothetical protein FWG66_10995 [Spirochaetes bacterium]|nr:hypothetical protein [Spirochaetota bacterium]
MNINDVFSIDDLNDLEKFLVGGDSEKVREELFAEFLRYADYKNASDWNKAVRLCECLAITGWGGHEAVQAVRGKFFNGSPETSFYNKFMQKRFVNAVWAKKKTGLTMEPRGTTYFHSPDLPDKKGSDEYPVSECIEDLKLQEQRNWIERNPVKFSRTVSNCDKNCEALVESIIGSLQPNLDANMAPEKYGKAVHLIIFNLNFSFEGFVKTNYIIADAGLNLTEKDFPTALLKMHSEAEIQKNGYYLRNRYEYGTFRAGVIRTDIYLEKALNELDYAAQKQKISFFATEALGVVADKLKKKKLAYDFDLMRADFLKIMDGWKHEV